jgi:hypothetical protein
LEAKLGTRSLLGSMLRAALVAIWPMPALAMLAYRGARPWSLNAWYGVIALALTTIVALWVGEVAAKELPARRRWTLVAPAVVSVAIALGLYAFTDSASLWPLFYAIPAAVLALPVAGVAVGTAMAIALALAHIAPERHSPLRVLRSVPIYFVVVLAGLVTLGAAAFAGSFGSLVVLDVLSYVPIRSNVVWRDAVPLLWIGLPLAIAAIAAAAMTMSAARMARPADPTPTRLLVGLPGILMLGTVLAVLGAMGGLGGAVCGRSDCRWGPSASIALVAVAVAFVAFTALFASVFRAARLARTADSPRLPSLNPRYRLPILVLLVVVVVLLVSSIAGSVLGVAALYSDRYVQPAIICLGIAVLTAVSAAYIGRYLRRNRRAWYSPPLEMPAIPPIPPMPRRVKLLAALALAFVAFGLLGILAIGGWSIGHSGLGPPLWPAMLAVVALFVGIGLLVLAAVDDGRRRTTVLRSMAERRQVQPPNPFAYLPLTLWLMVFLPMQLARGDLVDYGYWYVPGEVTAIACAAAVVLAVAVARLAIRSAQERPEAELIRARAPRGLVRARLLACGGAIACAALFGLYATPLGLAWSGVAATPAWWFRLAALIVGGVPLGFAAVVFLLAAGIISVREGELARAELRPAWNEATGADLS